MEPESAAHYPIRCVMCTFSPTLAPAPTSLINAPNSAAPAADKHDDNVEGDEVGDEDVRAPGGGHIQVGKGG